MVFTRKLDSTFPRVYDTWEVNDTKWIIQDMPPEDDQNAVDALLEEFVLDEMLCNHSKILEDPESIKGANEFWLECLSQRMSLACYEIVDGKKTLAGFNVCAVDSVDARFPQIEVKGDGFKQVTKSMMYIFNKADPFTYLGVNTLLHAYGLFVRRSYRGCNLGSRILSAREPMCLAQGITATATLFGPASQKSAARSGFETICVVSVTELVEHGFNYPKDETRTIAVMVKKYK